MIRNIVFDTGGVLIDYDPEKTLSGLFDAPTAQLLLREIFRNPLWSERTAARFPRRTFSRGRAR